MISARWVRALVAGVAAVGVVVPVLLGGVASEQPLGLVALTAVAVALAALLAWTPLGTAYAGSCATCGPPGRGIAPPLTSRVGDPVHHPVRPRAPGRV